MSTHGNAHAPLTNRKPKHVTIDTAEMLLLNLQLQTVAHRAVHSVVGECLFIFPGAFSSRLTEQGSLEEQQQSEKTDLNSIPGPPLGRCCLSAASPKALQPLFSLLRSHLGMQEREKNSLAEQVLQFQYFPRNWHGNPLCTYPLSRDASIIRGSRKPASCDGSEIAANALVCSSH